MTEENSCQVLQVFEPRKSLYNNEDKLNILDFPMEVSYDQSKTLSAFGKATVLKQQQKISAM